MTDAQWFIDSARSHINDVAADIERHFDSVATQLREFLSTDIPFAPRLISKPPPPPPTTYQVITRWVSKHRAITAAVVAFALTGTVGTAFFYQQRRINRKKRRAGKSTSGARTDVVVLAGAINSGIASTLALDLERRGYIVYAVSNGAEDEHYIRSFQRIDLLPLPLDLSDPYTAQEQMARFKHMLEKEHVAFEEAEPHRLQLKGLVLVPESASVPTGAVAEMSSEEWSDALNAKVLNTIATTQLFLPVLQEYSSRLLLLTPSVTSCLRLPGHSVENTVNAALTAFMSTLTSEMSSRIAVSQLKLGNFDIPALSAKQRREGVPAPRLRPTPLRVLHDHVFDTLSSRAAPARTYHVGRGSLAYDLVGSFAPASMVNWMISLGQRYQERKAVQTSNLPIEASASWERIEKDV